MRQLIVLLLLLTSQPALACSCVYVSNPCDYLSNEYTIPVIVHVDAMIEDQIAHVNITALKSDNSLPKENYVIVADTRTSCSRSIRHLNEGDNYIFGFPLHQLDKDTITYYQCMSPFYEQGNFPSLANCPDQIFFSELTIFPHPIQDNQILIRNDLLDPVRLSLFNTTGSLVLEQVNIEDRNHRVVLPDHIIDGIYFIRIESGIRGKVYSSKIVVAR